MLPSRRCLSHRSAKQEPYGRSGTHFRAVELASYARRARPPTYLSLFGAGEGLTRRCASRCICICGRSPCLSDSESERGVSLVYSCSPSFTDSIHTPLSPVLPAYERERAFFVRILALFPTPRLVLHHRRHDSAGLRMTSNGAPSSSSCSSV